MKLIGAIIEEIWGMFVDDGSLAVLSLLLIAIVTAAVKLLAFPAQWGGAALGVGCLMILAYSVHKAVQRD
ncbi:MAG TPA: hypothetical protein VL418_16525 [Devosiaceae bacterium]|jgi:hypothetical protein|nr:hypothetical protein [Devosiaceae bacterium]